MKRQWTVDDLADLTEIGVKQDGKRTLELRFIQNDVGIVCI